MALSVKAELQIVGLDGGELGVDGVPWMYAAVSDLKGVLYEQMKLPPQSNCLSLLAGTSGRPLADEDRLSDPGIQGKKLTVRGGQLPRSACRRQWFLPSTEVLLQGLTGAPELNGKRATVCSWDALKYRYEVLMDATKVRKSIKPDNLTPAWVSPLVDPAAAAFRGPRAPPEPRTTTQPQVPPSYSAAAPAYGAVHPHLAGLEPGSPAQERAPASRSPQSMSVAREPAAPAPTLAAPATRGAVGRQHTGDLEDLQQKIRREIQQIELEKAHAIQEEDYSRAAELKQRQRELEAEATAEKLPARLSEARKELDRVRAEKLDAVIAEDFKLAKTLKTRQAQLEADVEELEGTVARGMLYSFRQQ